MFTKQTEILKRIAANNDCVLIGWPGVGVLPRHPRVFSIFCHAPLSFRVKRAVQLGYAATAKQACQMILESDALRKKYFLTMTGNEWSCAENFHLSLDTSVLPLPSIADLIIEVLQRKQLLR